MSDTRTVRPVDGRRVRQPGSGKLLAGELAVAWTSYWQRLANAGDVEIVDAPRPPAPAHPAAAKKEG
jgi:hypothetical protein